MFVEQKQNHSKHADSSDLAEAKYDEKRNQ